jgi:hypothetical protein
MAAGIKYYSFWENLAKKKFDFTSDASCTVTLVFTNVAPTLTHDGLSDLSPISMTNMSSRVLTGIGITNTAGVITIQADPLVITASGTVPTWRYVHAYDDDSTGDLLMCYWDTGVSVNLLTGQSYYFNPTNGDIVQLN